MTLCCDAHVHLQDLAPDQREEYIAAMRAAGIRACVVNGTHPDDWPEVAKLATMHPGFVIPSFGLHPWKCTDVNPSWQQQLREQLEAFPSAGVGEIGLDRWVSEPSIGEQQTAFEWQWQLAVGMGRALSIHCLKAWGPLLESLETLPQPRQGFLLHSYGGSPELVDQLLPTGALFSFSGAFLHPRKAKVREAFQRVPGDRLLVETDAPEMRPPKEWDQFPDADINHPANLPAILHGLANIRAEPVEALAAQTCRNFERFFLSSADDD